MKTTKSFIKEFRSDLFATTGIELDFRRDVFIQNQYGNYPQSLSYDDAKSIISFLYEWANEYVEENKLNYPHFGGWEYNLLMSIEELRNSRLKDIIEDKCHDLFINFVDEFRREGNKVFKYSPENRAYIFDHAEY